MVDAEHEESTPQAPSLLISRLACSLVGQTQVVRYLPGSRLSALLGVEATVEQFRCNFGLNPLYRERVLGGALRAAALGENSEVRAVELDGHPFFIATLFLPQMSSSPAAPHPLLVAYLQAAISVD
jgi:CTP synthase (UTP-ammonia lyase)